MKKINTMEETIIPEHFQDILTARYKELIFIRCAGSCTILQFTDCLLTIRAADDGFSLEYQLANFVPLP
jgi:hypothetical protein